MQGAPGPEPEPQLAHRDTRVLNPLLDPAPERLSTLSAEPALIRRCLPSDVMSPDGRLRKTNPAPRRASSEFPVSLRRSEA